MSRLPPQTMPGKRKRPKSKEMSHFENRQFWFARNIPLLAEEVAARSNKKSRSDLFQRRRGPFVASGRPHRSCCSPGWQSRIFSPHSANKDGTVGSLNHPIVHLCCPPTIHGFLSFLIAARLQEIARQLSR